MPAVVDHESRRQHVARIAAGIIARVGMDAVTMRQIAAEAGFSTAIVTHYFANKQELMLHTYRLSAESVQARLAAEQRRDPCDLLACIEALLPRDADGMQDWKVFLAFWHIAVLDPAFSDEQASQALKAQAILRGILEARSAAGLPPRADDIDATARRLLVNVIGIAVQSVFDPLAWSPKTQTAYLQSELGELCGRPATAPSSRRRRK